MKPSHLFLKLSLLTLTALPLTSQAVSHATSPLQSTVGAMTATQPSPVSTSGATTVATASANAPVSGKWSGSGSGGGSTFTVSFTVKDSREIGDLALVISRRGSQSKTTFSGSFKIVNNSIFVGYNMTIMNYIPVPNVPGGVPRPVNIPIQFRGNFVSPSKAEGTYKSGNDPVINWTATANELPTPAPTLAATMQLTTEATQSK
ncbi:MAG: hypothetical protein IT324_08955 [Anaerolineae bacterium]|nr:hypothetical protein [Anaerolineae bacterium]